MNSSTDSPLPNSVLKHCTLFVLQGAALGAMVGQMTYGKRQFEGLDGVMRRLIPPFHQAVEELLLMVDADSCAFNSYMARRASLFTEHVCNVCAFTCRTFTFIVLICYRLPLKCQRPVQKK